MPLRTETELEDLQAQVRQRIIRSTADALDFLLEALPAGRPKHNQLLSLRSRAEQIRQWHIGNTRPLEQLTVLENELREDVLLFTQHLQLRDFDPAPPVRPELRPGHLLYRVPERMQLRQQHECLVRIAHTLEQVLTGLPEDRLSVTEPVPVAEVMQVEIIDPSPAEARAFDILLVSDGEQLVDEYSYTEWIFYVRPLREGPHDLVLKVSVLLTVRGKERTKNIVFRRRITVGTETTAAKPAPTLRRIGTAFGSGSKGIDLENLEQQGYPADDRDSWDDVLSPPPIAPRMSTRGDKEKAEEPSIPYVQPAPAPPNTPPRRTPRSRRRWLSVAASILVIVLAGWWVVETATGEYRNPGEQGADPTTPPDRTEFPDDPQTGPPITDSLLIGRDTIE